MSTIVGFKVGAHDGCVALLRDGKLVFSIEAEKLGRERHATFNTMTEVLAVLRSEGVEPEEVDEWVIEGHVAGVVSEFGKPRHQAPYEEWGLNALHAPTRGLLLPSGKVAPLSSFPHSIQHALGALATAPWHPDYPCEILVWDGGMPATLYRWFRHRLTRVAVLSTATGFSFGTFAACLEPWKDGAWAFAYGAGEMEAPPGPEVYAVRGSIPGKAMAYAGLGRPHLELSKFMEQLEPVPIRLAEMQVYVQACRDFAPRATDADLMATFQAYLGQQVTLGLVRHARSDLLAVSGGCGLNIKWNSMYRDCGHFADVWVPPFANDSGVAIGLVAARWREVSGQERIMWDVYAGPHLGRRMAPGGWRQRPMTPAELGAWIHATGREVVCLGGRAEIGPRALGHRSILAVPILAGVKDRINAIKGREEYRPVAPMCIASEAEFWFKPGADGNDGYMGFEHNLRGERRCDVPAIEHVDGSARLQTLRRQDGLAFEVLLGYFQASGVPILCNTSANRPGMGFFRDAAEAMEWGKVGAVYDADVATMWERTT